MITKQELLDVGFRIIGEDDSDPFYKIYFWKPVFGIHSLSGNFKENGKFEIYGIPYDIEEINQIRNIIDSLGLMIKNK